MTCRVLELWQLLKEKGLVPDLVRQVEDIVFPLDVELEGPASKVVSSLRRKGRSVDLIEDKRLKWYVSKIIIIHVVWH